MKIIHLIVAARPNFMKVAPLYYMLKNESWCVPMIIHTGQHYDIDMSDAFFRDLNMPEPTVHLGVGNGTHAEQTGSVMIAYEKVCITHRPDLTLVVGDVNSTMACAITAKKLMIPVAHLEAGLRSRDWSMPEEVNRVVTDSISDLLLTPSPDADENLIGEGVPQERICFVGNIMMDSYEMLRDSIKGRDAAREYGVIRGGFAVVTLHRPSNVDSKDSLAEICAILTRLAERIPVVFPVHPRTKDRLTRFGFWDYVYKARDIHLLPPIGYIQFMSLIGDCKFVITDSGGVQEETTYLGIPCLTLRPNTERPITVRQGTNRLVTCHTIEQYLNDILEGLFPEGTRPDFWDGKTAGRVAAKLRSFMGAGV